MKQFKVMASEIVDYEIDVEAENETEALEKAIMLDFNEWTTHSNEGWQIDTAREVE